MRGRRATLSDAGTYPHNEMLSVAMAMGDAQSSSGAGGYCLVAASR